MDVRFCCVLDAWRGQCGGTDAAADVSEASAVPEGMADSDLPDAIPWESLDLLDAWLAAHGK